MQTLRYSVAVSEEQKGLLLGGESKTSSQNISADIERNFLVCEGFKKPEEQGPERESALGQAFDEALRSNVLLSDEEIGIVKSLYTQTMGSSWTSLAADFLGKREFFPNATNNTTVNISKENGVIYFDAVTTLPEANYADEKGEMVTLAIPGSIRARYKINSEGAENTLTLEYVAASNTQLANIMNNLDLGLSIEKIAAAAEEEEENKKSFETDLQSRIESSVTADSHSLTLDSHGIYKLGKLSLSSNVQGYHFFTADGLFDYPKYVSAADILSTQIINNFSNISLTGTQKKEIKAIVAHVLLDVQNKAVPEYARYIADVFVKQSSGEQDKKIPLASDRRVQKSIMDLQYFIKDSKPSTGKDASKSVNSVQDEEKTNENNELGDKNHESVEKTSNQTVGAKELIDQGARVALDVENKAYVNLLCKAIKKEKHNGPVFELDKALEKRLLARLVQAPRFFDRADQFAPNVLKDQAREILFEYYTQDETKFNEGIEAFKKLRADRESLAIKLTQKYFSSNARVIRAPNDQPSDAPSVLDSSTNDRDGYQPVSTEDNVPLTQGEDANVQSMKAFIQKIKDPNSIRPRFSVGMFRAYQEPTGIRRIRELYEKLSDKESKEVDPDMFFKAAQSIAKIRLSETKMNRGPEVNKIYSALQNSKNFGEMMSSIISLPAPSLN